MKNDCEIMKELFPNKNILIKNDVRYVDSVKLTDLEESNYRAKLKEVEAEYDALQYQRDRATEYPALAEQLDEIYHNGIDSWKTIIKVTKDKYPKG